MVIESKFNVGDNVWFPHNGKYYHGEIIAIPSWEDDNGFLYKLEYINMDDTIVQTFQDYAYEKIISVDKESLFKKLFVEK